MPDKKRTLEEWVEGFCDLRCKGVEIVVAQGKYLIECKVALGHGRFGEFLSRVPFNERKAQKSFYYESGRS